MIPRLRIVKEVEYIDRVVEKVVERPEIRDVDPVTPQKPAKETDRLLKRNESESSKSKSEESDGQPTPQLPTPEKESSSDDGADEEEARRQTWLSDMERHRARDQLRDQARDTARDEER
jgi:hypothetical protein